MPRAWSDWKNWSVRHARSGHTVLRRAFSTALVPQPRQMGTRMGTRSADPKTTEGASRGGAMSYKSGRPDLNRGPPAPKAKRRVASCPCASRIPSVLRGVSPAIPLIRGTPCPAEIATCALSWACERARGLSHPLPGGHTKRAVGGPGYQSGFTASSRGMAASRRSRIALRICCCGISSPARSLASRSSRFRVALRTRASVSCQSSLMPKSHPLPGGNASRRAA